MSTLGPYRYPAAAGRQRTAMSPDWIAVIGRTLVDQVSAQPGDRLGQADRALLGEERGTLRSGFASGLIERPARDDGVVDHRPAARRSPRVAP